MTVFPKWYVRCPLLSLSTIALPGVYSVIVPLPSVVVVVVVVSETCPHANGATTANTMLKSILFMISLSCLSCCGNKSPVPVQIWAGQELAAILDSNTPCWLDASKGFFNGA